MPVRRRAATKVIVFQCPCGTRPTRRSPRRQRPLSRTIFVLAAVSSMNTSRAGSNMPCSRCQRRRESATSARSCSAARRLFFECDLVALEETPHCGAAARNLVLAHHSNELVERQVRLDLDQPQQKLSMRLQRRGAPATPLGGTAASLTKALHPGNRRAGADIIVFSRLTPRASALDPRNHALAHVSRISLGHCPASQKRINADRLPHSEPRENPAIPSERNMLLATRYARPSAKPASLPAGAGGESPSCTTT